MTVFGVNVPLRVLFEQPTIAALAEHVDALRQGGGLTDGEAPDPERPALVAQPRPEAVPLSFAQQRAWFFDEWATDSPLNTIISGLRLRGALDVRALESSLTAVAARHEALRTTFDSSSGRPHQVIAAPAPVAVSVTDLSRIPQDRHDAEVLRIATAEARSRFDLVRGPLLRVRLLRLQADEHILLLSLHHTIADGRSLEILLGELTALYTAVRTDQPADLPELPVQYADYALWERSVPAATLDRQLAYWREQLAGAPDLLELTTDHPRPPALGFDGASQDFTVPEEVREAVHRVGRDVGATPFMTLLAAFQVVLSRCSGQDDIVVATPMGRRPTAETDRLIGFFSNTLALRTDLGGDPTFAQLVARVRDMCLDTYANQDVPFEQLVAQLRPVRDTSHAPLAQVACDYKKVDATTVDWPDVQVDLLETAPGNGTAKFDLTLNLVEAPEALTGTLVYNTDLFTARTAGSYAGRILAALEELTAQPHRRLSEAALLPPAERSRLVGELSRTPAPEAPALCLHELVSAQAARTPDAVAVSIGPRQLTYAALDARADRLARWLRARGVGRESRVAVCLERSLDLVIALLGVMKAGGVHVPLDPSYPPDRLAFMLQDSRAAVVLTESGPADGLPGDAPVILLDTVWPGIRVGPEGEPLPRVHLDNLAYLIYTSGSTGTPKGTMVSHRGIAPLAQAQAAGLGLGPGSRVLQFASLSFDASVFEVLMALSCGGTLCMAERERLRPGRDLLDTLDELAVTATVLPPSALAVTPAAELPALATVAVAGEACPAEVVAAWAPGRAFHNLYGPTEATIWTSMARCVPGERVGIGRPVAASGSYVLDRAMRPAPVGVPGELYLGGPGLARGYLGRPGLTAERFVPDPFGTEPGARLYRTGDRVRFQDDGNLFFLGRVDHQVKVRGFRIEPGEIESVLRAVPGVSDAVVLLREDRPGVRRLVGYVLAESGGVTTVLLRDHCARRLPEYMVPAVFAVLEEFPHLPNGKLDRRALPEPGAERPDLEVSYSPPVSPVERALADIWAKVLGVERVGRDDDFFALGGDSILSIQAIGLATRAGLAVTHRLLFQNPTVAALAAAAGSASAPATAEQGEVSGPVPPSPIQRWFLDQELPAPQHYNQALLVRPRTPLHEEPLRTALRALTTHHDALRLRLRRPGGRWELDNAPVAEAPAVTLRTADLGAASPDARRAALADLAAEAHAGMDPASGCLLRAVRVGLGEDGERLLLVAHHLAVDGVSWRILLEDLATAYRQAAAGEPVVLPAKTTAFRTWAEHLAEQAASERFHHQIPYWTRVLADSAEAPLPLDHDGGQDENTYGESGTVALDLDTDTTDRLLRAGRATVHELLLTALGLVLTRWTGRDRVVVDTEGHGRGSAPDSLDLSRTVGWFTTVHPLALDTAGSPGAALVRVQEELRRVPDDGVGYGLLRYYEAGGAAGALRAAPAPQVCFNYLGQVDQSFAADSPWLPATEPSGAGQAPQERRPYLLDVAALVADGRLRLSLTYGRRVHRRETAQQLLTDLREQAVALLSAPRPVAPSRFPLVALDQAALERIAEAAGDGAGRAGDIDDMYPLSPMQEGMLFHTLREPGGGSYVVQMAARFEGGFDPECFRSAWQRVVARHAVLRTSFHWEGLARPVQVVHHSVPTPLDVQDWRGHHPDEQQSRMAAFLDEDRERGFPLSPAPLVRLTLVRQADDLWQLVWTHHHLLLDGWSMPLVVRELFDGYAAARKGRQLTLPPPPPYSAYIAWLERQDPADAERFWRGQLAGFEEPTPLPAESAPREARGQGYATQEVRLPAEATTALQGLARRFGLTSSTLLNAAWALVLGGHSGEDDVVFGVTVAGRPPELPGVESTVGLFINTLPARVRVEGDLTVGAWLRRVHSRLSEMQDYAFPSLVRMQGWSDVPRGRGLFDSIVVFENSPVDTSAGTELSGVRTRQLRTVEQTDYPLTLTSAPGPRLLLSLLYDRGRYTPSTVRRLLAQLRRVLEGMAAGPDRPVRELSLLDADERRTVLTVWNSDTGQVPAEPFLHHLVERHAGRTPDAVAVVGGEHQLTYGALNARADRVARALRRRGVGPEIRVGLLMDRTPSLLVALVAVLKSGGAYVPLDPAFPADRIAHLVGDAGIRLVLRDTAGPALPVPTAALDVLAAEAGADPAGPPRGAVAENLAYVVYTSGSTGRPKGVQVSHRNLAAAAAGWRDAYELSPGDRHLQMAGAAFDVFTGDTARALGSGATLVLCPRDLLLDPSSLARRIEEQGITCAEFVPVVLRHVIEAVRAGGDRLGSLRLLVAGSDAWPARDHRAAGAIGGPETRVVNSYGVTEATVDSTWFAGGADGLDTDAQVPIGRPIGRSRVYVLDRYGEPAAVGVPGELHIGGPQVTRGYLGQPGRTAERFVPDPFGAVPGGRLYRTGDKARWRPDGTLDFLGRLDSQLKLRGVRIEPGEVEAALADHPAVRDAVVTVRTAPGGEPQLIGYVAADDPSLAEEIRAAAARRLTAAMVPTSVVVLETLPVTPNGKLDRAALPAPDAPRAAGHVPPDTPAEKDLAGIWEQLLGVGRAGAEDSFFALGGDSIVSLQVVSRMRAAGWAVTPRQVFETTTLRELAAVAVPTAGAVLAEQGVVTGPVPLTPVQAAFFEEEHPAPHHYNQAMLLRARGPVDREALGRALEHLVRHHDALRLCFVRSEDTREGAGDGDGDEYGGWPPDDWKQEQAGTDGLPAQLLEVQDLSAVPDRDLPAAVEAAAARFQAGLDLAAGLLLRAVYLDLGADRPGRLLLVVHHLAVDGVSWRILLEDLHLAYTQLLDGRPVSLPPKTTSFRDWATALERHAHSDDIGRQAGHWLSVAAAGARTGLPLDTLPGDDETLADVNTRADLATVTRALDTEQTRLLLQEAPAAYRARIDEVLLTAAGSALAEWAGENSLLLDLEGHGREDLGPHLDLSRTVGWFTSIHPVLLDLAPGDPVQSLHRAKGTLRGVPGRGLGYGLIRYLRTGDPEAERLADLPSAVLAFNYLGQLDQSFEAEGLWEPAQESEGPSRDMGAPRRYLVEIDALVLNGRLHFTWSYSRRLHDEATIAELADRCLEILRVLMASRDTPEARSHTPADFGAAGLSAADLDDLLAPFGPQ